jgi:hypothetical protein
MTVVSVLLRFQDIRMNNRSLPIYFEKGPGRISGPLNFLLFQFRFIQNFPGVINCLYIYAGAIY